MLRRAWMLLAPLALAGGCTCGSKQSAPAPQAAPQEAAPAPTPSVTATIAVPLDLQVFSAPIGGARAAGGDVVAGLVASDGVVRVIGLTGGQPTWAVDALHDVAWAPDAELRLQATSGGLALVWRGPRAGKTGRTLVVLGPRGELRGAAIEIGSAFCATDAGVAWIDARSSGPAKVLARGWSEPSARVMTRVPSDRDPGLVCADRDVAVLGDGDDDLTATSFTPGEPAARAPVVAIRDADFGDDEERDHDAYSVGDDLGIVRVASSGAITMRDIPRATASGAWRRLKHIIPADDDIVAVDGDADSTIIVYTHDADEACPGVGASAESVRALRVVRKTGDEAQLDLAPADCDTSPGPFWVATTPLGTAVGWIERKAKSDGHSLPIAGASFRLLLPGSVQARRIEQPADALVDSGCDARGCSLAALLRPPAGDGMQPEKISVLPYP